MADLTYPEPWLLGWRDVLWNAPGDHPMPRVDVIAVGATRKGMLGAYDPRRHVVRVYADGDRVEVLGTLIHELAHAWAPSERSHHGPAWRKTYVDLFAWLTGWVIDLERLPGEARRICDQLGLKRKINAAVLSASLDELVTMKLHELAPQIWHRLDDDGTPRAVEAVIGKRHCIKVRT